MADIPEPTFGFAGQAIIDAMKMVTTGTCRFTSYGCMREGYGENMKICRRTDETSIRRGCYDSIRQSVVARLVDKVVVCVGSSIVSTLPLQS